MVTTPWLTSHGKCIIRDSKQNTVATESIAGNWVPENKKVYCHLHVADSLCCTLTIAANWCDVIAAVVEIVATDIAVAARGSFAVFVSTAPTVASCSTALVGGSYTSPWIACTAHFAYITFTATTTCNYKQTKRKKSVIVLPIKHNWLINSLTQIAFKYVLAQSIKFTAWSNLY